MKLYAVSQNDPDPHDPNFLDHLLMCWLFHCEDKSHGRNRWEEEGEPMELIKNLRYMSPMFFSGDSILVRHDVANQLASCQGLRFIPAVWHRVYDLEAEACDAAKIKQDMANRDVVWEEWVEPYFIPIPAWLDEVEMYELVAPEPMHLAKEYPPNDRLVYNDETWLHRPTEVMTNFRAHRDYPIMFVSTRHYIQRTHIFNEQAYRVVEPILKQNPKMFWVDEITGTGSTPA